MTTKGNIAADFDSLTELLDNLSKGLDLDPIRPNTTTPTKPTPVTTPVKLPPPMTLPKVDLTDDLMFAPKASISSVASPLSGTLRSPQPKKDELQELEDIRLQEEHDKVREKMRHVEEQKKALEIKKREELKKLEEDLGIELDLDVPVTPTKSQLPPKLVGQQSTPPPTQAPAATVQKPKGTLLLDKFLEDDLLASIAPQQSSVETVPVSTRLPSTYGTSRTKTDDYGTKNIPSDIPDYDEFMQTSFSEPKKEVAPTTNSRTKISTNTSIEGNNTFRNFMASGSNMPPIKATKPGTMKASGIPDYSTFLASQDLPIPQEENKRTSSKFSTPVVATAKGVSTRNLEELSKMYQENKTTQYNTLTRQSLVPLAGEKEPHPETLSRIDSVASMKSQASSVFSEDTVESDDTENTSVSRQESLQDVLDSLTTMDQIQESKDDKFLENFQEFAKNYGTEGVEKLPPKSAQARRSPNPASLDPFGTNRDRRRSASIANAAETQQFHTIATRGGTPKLRVLAADLGTAMAEELNKKGASEARPVPRSGQNTLRSGQNTPRSGQNTLRLDVDSIVTERQKRDTIRSTQAMLNKKVEEAKLPQLNKIPLDSSLTRTRSQQNIASSPSDTMKRSHIARKLHPHLPQILLNVALMDDSTKKIVVTSDFTVQDVIYAFAEKLGLWQTEYFFLAEKLANGSDRWLESSYTVEETGIGSESVLVFKVKYWKQPKKLIDPTAIHLFYLQLFQNIKSGFYKVPSGLALRLAALVMQIMYGDYEKSKHKIDYFDEPLIQVLVPESARKGVPIEYIEQQIFRLHLSFKGLQKTDAKMKYINEAKRLTTYGVTLYDVVEDGIERRLGIAEDGLLISIKNNKDAYDFYPFNEIDDWALTTHGFDVKINNPDKKPYFSFGTENSEQICDLISGYYTLLRYQIFGRNSFWPVNVPHYAGSLPDHQLYHLPTKRDMFDAFGSRAEVFKSVYLDESAKAGKPSVVGLIKQIDLYITAENASSCIAETLALNGCGMNTEQLEIIANSLAKAFKYQPARPDHIFLEDLSIKTLNASYNVLTEEAALFIGAIMECPIPLKTLDLTELKLGVKGAKTLVSYLEHCNTLEQLVMPYNELTNKGVLAILGAIKNSRNLHSFNFAWNNFDDKIMPNLLEIFPSKPNIQSISLAGNKLGDASIKNLVVALRKMQSKSITHLDLSNLVLTSATKHVIEWLVDNPQVERFYIANCKLADKSALQLAKVMNESKLTILDVRNCNLGTRSLKAIMSALAANRKLTELHVSGNKISKSVGQLLCDAVDVHRSLSVLTLRNCDLRKSTLILLFKALKKDKNIKILDLALNVDLGSSSSEMTESIEEMLNQNKTLEELNISACKLSSKTIAALIPGLGRNTCLKALRLDANKLGKDVVKIATAIKQPGNSKIEELTLRKCDISTKNLQSFFEALGPNAQLKRILLEKNGIKATKFQDINKMYPLLAIRL